MSKKTESVLFKDTFLYISRFVGTHENCRGTLVEKHCSSYKLSSVLVVLEIILKFLYSSKFWSLYCIGLNLRLKIKIVIHKMSRHIDVDQTFKRNSKYTKNIYIEEI